MNANTTTEVLIAARYILDHLKWHQGSMYQYTYIDRGYEVIGVCAVGAIEHTQSSFDLKTSARQILANVVKELVPNWNDRHGRTKKQVLKAFDKAIKLSKKTSQ